MDKEFRLYDYQEKVAKLLLRQHNIILQAPTGAGKTTAALLPYIKAFAELPAEPFPRKCIYSVPLRVLANQFVAEYKARAASYRRRFRRDLPVTIQTGDRPDDRQFEGGLIFTTIDQTLSNLLGVPYAVGSGRANLNAGAVIASYLVFDEFHLFPPEGALTTTLQWLRLLKGTTPFTLMTATFSAQMLDALAERLGATPITVREDELKVIETSWGKFSRRERCLHVVNDLLRKPESVLDAHAGRRRSIAIRNTVGRARELYDNLVEQGCRPLPFHDPRLNDLYTAIKEAQNPTQREQALEKAVGRLYDLIHEQPDWEHVTWIVLLHARFARAHRDLKEEFVRREFGPEEKCPWKIPSIILIATQAIEVGLDITSDVLHTEIAPPASVLQRAGRCARFPGQHGEVYVYHVPPRKDGKPNYAPYATKTEMEICELGWDAFQRRNGCVLRFPDEQEVINEAHTRADKRLLKAMDESEGRIWAEITNAVVLGDTAARRELIRRVDSRTLLVHDDPDALGNPYRIEGFSLWQGSLRGALDDLLDRADELDLDQVLWYPVLDPTVQQEDSRQPSRYFWKPVTSQDHLGLSLLFAVHPDLVAYDAERGFRFVDPGQGGVYRSTPAPTGKGRDRDQYTYQLESYRDHVAAMARIYRRDLHDELAYVARRLAEHSNPDLKVPEGMLDRAVRLAIALHDAGKLQVEWQAWARAYQKQVTGEEPPFLVAHTLSETEEHRKIARQIHPKRPHHAGEGALAGAKILWEALDGRNNRGPYLATVTTIARHHTPGLYDAAPFRLEPRARAVLAEALAAAGDEMWCDWASSLIMEQEAPLLEKRLLKTPPEHPWGWWLLYFLIVRAVRLADGKSQQEEG
jgi:CRISPR-associated endonuclease/helicase Cas3